MNGGIFDAVTTFFVDAENWGIPYLPIHVAFLDMILALDACSSYRKAMGKESHPILQVFFACIVGTFGGTTMTAIILGQPPGWLSSLGSPVAFAMGFWLVFCCPGNLVYKSINAIWPLHFTICLINCISCGHGVTSWGADKALKSVHLPSGSGPYALLCGTMSGCGGGVLAGWLHLTGDSRDWVMATPPVLRKASATVKTAATTSIIYYFLRNPHGFLPWSHDVLPHNECKAVVFLIWVSVLVLREVARVDDPLAPLVAAVRAALLLPEQVSGGEAPVAPAAAAVDGGKPKVH